MKRLLLASVLFAAPAFALAAEPAAPAKPAPAAQSAPDKPTPTEQAAALQVELQRERAEHHDDLMYAVKLQEKVNELTKEVSDLRAKEAAAKTETAPVAPDTSATPAAPAAPTASASH